LTKEKELITEEELLAIYNLTDKELDEKIKEEMRRQGHTKFVNYEGVEEDL
jgi:hypothetical protein